MKTEFPFQEVLESLLNAIPSEYQEGEKQQTIKWILESVFGVTSAQLLTRSPLSIDPEKLKEVTTRLANHEPVQYIMGEVNFYGCQLKVASGVLIPRPETEELAYRIVQENKTENIEVIWDLCSGSGCLAISLAKELKAKTFGVDIHPKAIELGSENAKLNYADTDFFRVDLLNEKLPELPPPQIIVSNPPYVTENEKQLMRPNVLHHEPHIALFVSEGSPLIFYDRIFQIAQEKLMEGGKIYLEINEQFGRETQALAFKYGFSTAEIWQDWSGKDRFVKAVK